MVPEFLYVPAYDDKHRVRQVRSDSPRVRLAQKGIRERLLCGGCEKIINDRYELPISRVWRRLIPDQIPLGHDSLAISGFDYGTFKLFNLSILWRASVARGAAWAHVNLGERHEQALRAMLLERDPGPALRYPFFGNVMLTPETRDVALGIVMAPTFGRYKATRVYMFIYGGCSWHFLVSSHTAIPHTPYVALEAGTMVLSVRDLRDNRAFDKHMRAHVESLKATGDGADGETRSPLR